jgi:hypothetical protein
MIIYAMLDDRAGFVYVYMLCWMILQDSCMYACFLYSPIGKAPMNLCYII